MSSECLIQYGAIFYNGTTCMYTAEVIFPDGSEVTLEFESYEQWERVQANVNIPTMRYLYANG